MSATAGRSSPRLASVFAAERLDEVERMVGGWRPAPYRTFTRAKPKPRLISAAPFRHGVIQQRALVQGLTAGALKS